MEKDQGKQSKGHRDRDWKILELVRDFLLSWAQFKELYAKYQKGGLTFHEVSRFIDDKDPYLPLFNLKETSHALFRYPGNDPYDDEERLLDLAIGSIFHEAMKVRENLYQLEVYRPKFIELSDKVHGDEKLLEEFAKIGKRAERGLKDGLLEMKRLFEDTALRLKAFLPKYIKENPLFLRFFLQRLPLFRKTYGRKGLEELLRRLFPKGLSEAYRKGAEGLLESGQYEMAMDFLKRAFRYNGDKKNDLSFLYFYAKGVSAFLKNRYRASLFSLERAMDLSKGLKEKSKYLRMMGEICLKMGKELAEEKRERLSKRALDLAAQASKLSRGARRDAHL
ncbi:hypothetical protein DRO34_04195 [Candidatus Bathyarchaeota archaeon]|nr:MAG: hypothetical protein DRO34_04195 [Candidatus Bathyarchaeota archaeon]